MLQFLFIEERTRPSDVRKRNEVQRLCRLSARCPLAGGTARQARCSLAGREPSCVHAFSRAKVLCVRSCGVLGRLGQSRPGARPRGPIAPGAVSARTRDQRRAVHVLTVWPGRGEVVIVTSRGVSPARQRLDTSCNARARARELYAACTFLSPSRATCPLQRIHTTLRGAFFRLLSCVCAQSADRGHVHVCTGAPFYAFFMCMGIRRDRGRGRRARIIGRSA